ncbi:MAG: signal peptidase II [Hyphomonadaceae bacterium]|nr:signal peptidase II [Hyphomonadaceae bacterium]
MNGPVTSGRIAHLWIIPALVALDLATKAWARAELRYGEPIEVLPFFNLTLGYNRGVAFGLLNDAGGLVVLLVTAAISLMFAVWLWREPRPLTRLGLAFVLGGALGNFLDRLSRGEVTDFLDLHVSEQHWPAFNLADAAITCGAVLLVLDMLRARKESTPPNER